MCSVSSGISLSVCTAPDLLSQRLSVLVAEKP